MRQKSKNATIELKKRTQRFAIQTIFLFRTLPKTEEARIVGRQLLRSATSLAANYRAACRARSKAEFVAKIGVVAEEADDTAFWLETLFESGICKSEKLGTHTREANEILAIFAASQRTARSGITSGSQ